MKLQNWIFSIPVLLVGLTACEGNMEEIILSDRGLQNSTNSKALTKSDITIEKDSALMAFASILSKTVSCREDIREFLKAEASKHFDMNADILYGSVKNVHIGEMTFRDILASYSSYDEILVIENSLPLLNILIPEIKIFDISAENLDCKDNEIPVAISRPDGMALYLDGKYELTIPNGELPDFHTFVVNENSRVEVEPSTRGNDFSYKFRSPNFDIRNFNKLTTRATESTSSEVGYKAVQAYSYFYKDDGSKNSKAFQRDYIYYGITPANGNGTLNYAVTEYIGYIEVNPKSYFNISDQYDKQIYDDPKIVKNSVSRKGKDYSQEDLIKEMWSQGNYDFRFEISSSQNSRPIVTLVSLSPDDIWDFNYDRHVRHKTWFRSRKYTYTIDPQKFTAKKYDLSAQNITFGKWDLSQEAMERYISIFEEDKATTSEYTTSYEMTTMTSAKVNGSIKFGLGTTKSGELGTDLNTSTTRKETKSFHMIKSEQDDALGTIKIYFYDPIILGKVGNNYSVNEYNTGIVKFGIYVK